MIDAESPELHVAPLPEPVAPPWPDDGAGAEEAGNAPGVGTPPELTRDDLVDMLVGAVQVPFALAALVRGSHWDLTDAEALSIARPLSRALPPAWLTSRIVAASPWLVVAGATYRVVAPRLAYDAAIAATRTPQEAPPDDDTRAGRGAARGPGAHDGQPPPPDPLPFADQPANPGDFAGAGLGLGGPSDAAPDDRAAPRPGPARAGRPGAAPAN